MRVYGGLLAVAALLSAPAAFAATPKLSGTYNLMTSTVCQASVPVIATEVDVPPFNNVPTTTDILTIDPNETTYTGGLGQMLAAVTFTPGAINPHRGKVALNGTTWGGDLVYTGSGQGTTQGLQQQSASDTGTYAATATTLTLTTSGNVAVYQILYSNIVGGVAQQAALVQVYTTQNSGGAGCIEHGTATHQ